ncbi:hypothetical protein [Nocardia pseudobrasiliensis]|uniref:hypothetical protein n=1 Tax=Nocardia pseudobrasiliensis TaxID=45979 RepID=UPI0011C05E44|nr:hypothetical protein [Nocardia pseudobrasiliensis]
MGFLAGVVPLLLVLAGFGFQYGGPLAVLTGERMVRMFGADKIRSGYWLWLRILGATPIVSWVIGIVVAAAALWQGGLAFGAGMLISLALVAALAVAVHPRVMLHYFFMWTADPAPNS